MQRKIHFPNWDSLHSGDSIVLTGLKWYIHLSTPLLAAKLATCALKSWSWWRQMQMDIPKIQVFLRIHRLHMLFFCYTMQMNIPKCFLTRWSKEPPGCKKPTGRSPTARHWAPGTPQLGVQHLSFWGVPNHFDGNASLKNTDCRICSRDHFAKKKHRCWPWSSSADSLPLTIRLPSPGLVSHVHAQALTSFDCDAFLAKTHQDTPLGSSSKYHWSMSS